MAVCDGSLPENPHLKPSTVKVRATLTPEEFVDLTSGSPKPETYQAVARWVLYGQPFGFTREDVDALRRLAAWHDGKYYDVNHLADRIEALLPPEGE